ncbi:MAG: VCBS repeat-containing protein [Deltaproteobacteria bacterium]|nr:VCBS repeat-containing protein [Deltaproteobacteria bacterium]
MKLLTHVGIWCTTLVLALTLADVGQAASKKKKPAKSTAAKNHILTDPDGQQYTLKRLAKKDLRYHKRADGSVRVLPYFLYQLAREDDDYLYVKEYLTPKDEAAPTPSPAVQPAEAVQPAPLPPVTLESVNRLTLTPFSDGLPTQGQWRNRFDIADMNGDGHLDIVHGPPRKGGGGPRIFLGDSAGHWLPWKDAVYPRAGYDYGAVAVADFNGDTSLDLALAVHLKGLTVLLGDGKGAFRLGAGPEVFEPDAATRFTSRALVAHDWNRDGKADLIALGEGPRPGGKGGGSFGTVVYLNQGSDQWRKQRLSAADNVFGDTLAAGDVNNDGQTDILTASLAFDNKKLVQYGGGDTAAAEIAALPPRAYTYAVALADVDQDQRDDVIVGALSQEGEQWSVPLTVLLSRADGTWPQVTLANSSSRNVISALAAGDIDGDKNTDITALDSDGLLRLFLGDGKGGFVEEQSAEVPSLGAGCRGYHLRLVDLNADSRAEIIASFASEPVVLSGQMGCAGNGRLQVWSPSVR